MTILRPSTMPDTPQWSDPLRQAFFDNWFEQVARRFQLDAGSLHLASADASFRRYFRVWATPSTSYVIMDSPPEKENNDAFVAIAQLIEKAGLRGPKVLEWNQQHGFLLLTDLGHQTLLECLDKTNPNANLAYFDQATTMLVQWQLSSISGVLPLYDGAKLQSEMGLFDQWYLSTHKAVHLTTTQTQVLADTYQCIVNENLKQPNVFVHRDFMPRNLMVPLPPETTLGILDFQDAVYGPLTYDIASLTRDAFWSWEEDFVLEVTIRYWEKARKSSLPVPEDFGDFYRAVDWMALQRHLKVAGIFARLTLRDGKPKYLADAPRFIAYIRQTAGRYRELKPLLHLIDKVEGLEALSGFAYGRI
jgi:aminoglycoside/choline kinase family phosphotransferase